MTNKNALGKNNKSSIPPRTFLFYAQFYLFMYFLFLLKKYCFVVSFTGLFFVFCY